jgi:hypothetical protein
MKNSIGRKRAFWTAAAGAMFLLYGCSNSSPAAGSSLNNIEKPFSRGAKVAGPPRVENCAIISVSTPTLYRCNGKTYTSIELAEIAQGKPVTPRPKVPPSVPRSLIQP